jgi:hypothetical protein
MEQPEMANFVIREVNQNLFLTKTWFLINGERKFDWGAVKEDAYCWPLTYAEAENGIKELMNHDLYHGTWEICQRTKKGVTLDKV